MFDEFNVIVIFIGSDLIYLNHVGKLRRGNIIKSIQCSSLKFKMDNNDIAVSSFQFEV